ncbi:MAG: hypothetical protein AAFO94_05380, partial [Bacteroidota bacterium]
MIRIAPRVGSCCLLLIFLLLACGDDKRITEDLSAFGFEIETAVRADNPELVNEAFDYAAFSGHLGSRIGMRSPAEIRIIANNIKSNIKIGQSIVNA